MRIHAHKQVRRRMILMLAMCFALLLPFVAQAADMLPLSQVDPVIAEALREAAAELGQPLTELELTTDPKLVTGAQAVTALTLTAQDGLALTDAGALGYLPALTTLTIQGGQMPDLEGLRDHPNLKSLTLIDCRTTDLSPLADCARLNEVTLIRSEGSTDAVYDLTPLAGCARLTSLILRGECADDLSSLAQMGKLTRLTLENLPVTDYSPIAALNALTGIQLTGVPGEQVALAFAGLSRKLQNAFITDSVLTPEANAAILRCTRLKSLGFTRVQGVDSEAEGWSRMTSLSCLSMEGGSLQSLAFLAEKVTYAGTKLTDIALGAEQTVCTVDFDKYFLHLVNVPSGEIVNLLSGETRLWNYATVDMQGQTISPEAIVSLGSVGGLLSLDVQNVAPQAFDATCWSGFASLQQLKLRDCEWVPAKVFAGLPALTRLALTNCALTEQAAPAPEETVAATGEPAAAETAPETESPATESPAATQANAAVTGGETTAPGGTAPMVTSQTAPAATGTAEPTPTPRLKAEGYAKVEAFTLGGLPVYNWRSIAAQTDDVSDGGTTAAPGTDAETGDNQTDGASGDQTGLSPANTAGGLTGTATNAPDKDTAGAATNAPDKDTAGAATNAPDKDTAGAATNAPDGDTAGMVADATADDVAGPTPSASAAGNAAGDGNGADASQTVVSAEATPAPTQTEGMLSAAGKLQVLSLIGCTVENWAFLDTLRCSRTLTTLSIAGCDGPDTLMFLNGLPRLTTLTLEDATATKLLPIGTLTELSTLSLYGCAATDYAVLANLPSLRKLYCSENAALPELACRVTRQRLIDVR